MTRLAEIVGYAWIAAIALCLFALTVLVAVDRILRRWRRRRRYTPTLRVVGAPPAHPRRRAAP